MIARTEVGSSTSYARTEQMRRDGVKRHMWLTSRDSHVRDTHEALEGVERSVGEAWGNGLLYPLDPNGPASEIINCRCTTKPLIEDPPEPPPIPRLSSAPTVDLLVCMDDEEPNTLLLLGGEVLRQVRPGESVNGRTYDELKAACILQGPFMLALTPEQANANPNE
jgi:SPP1 gp7 family putative phage head morphogenesis protein